MREVMKGGRYIAPSVAAVSAARLGHRSRTSRELEVLRMVAKGLGNKEIGAVLDIAEVTVKLHVSHVLEKLNVRDRTEAATAAFGAGDYFRLCVLRSNMAEGTRPFRSYTKVVF